MYDFAVANEIINKIAVGDGFEYHLNIFDDAETSECMNVMQKIIDMKDVQRASAFLSNRNGKSFAIKSHRVIPITQNSDYADLIVKDDVLGSRLNIQILSEQVSIIKNYSEKMEELSKLVNAARMNKISRLRSRYDRTIRINHNSYLRNYERKAGHNDHYTPVEFMPCICICGYGIRYEAKNRLKNPENTL